MAVTIHPESPNELFRLVLDLELLDGHGGPYRVRRAIHGSGAIVEDDLALLWLTLTRNPTPEFLQSLMRQDPALYDLVGRVAPDWALQELARFEADSVSSDGEVQLTAVRFDGNRSLDLAVTPDISLVDNPYVKLFEDEGFQIVEPLPTPEVPAARAPKSDWETWATESGLVGTEQAAEMTKSQLRDLAGPALATAPKEIEEG